MKVTQESEETIVVKMTPEEAGVLACVCSYIGGKTSGRRGIFSSRNGSLLGQLMQLKNDRITNAYGSCSVYDDEYGLNFKD